MTDRIPNGETIEELIAELRDAGAKGDDVWLPARECRTLVEHLDGLTGEHAKARAEVEDVRAERDAIREQFSAALGHHAVCARCADNCDGCETCREMRAETEAFDG